MRAGVVAGLDGQLMDCSMLSTGGWLITCDGQEHGCWRGRWCVTLCLPRRWKFDQASVHPLLCRPIPGHTEVMGMKTKVSSMGRGIASMRCWVDCQKPDMAQAKMPPCHALVPAGCAHAVASHGRSVLGGAQGGVKLLCATLFHS